MCACGMWYVVCVYVCECEPVTSCSVDENEETTDEGKVRVSSQSKQERQAEQTGKISYRSYRS